MHLPRGGGTAARIVQFLCSGIVICLRQPVGNGAAVLEEEVALRGKRLDAAINCCGSTCKMNNTGKHPAALDCGRVTHTKAHSHAHTLTYACTARHKP